ncbi:MAG TPA: amidohydrolase family protein [Steroidobacteraceae bacterium]|nr:amidohydrolase family protein [Steroidobacteraceae bacterium]
MRGAPARRSPRLRSSLCPLLVGFGLAAAAAGARGRAARSAPRQPLHRRTSNIDPIVADRPDGFADASWHREQRVSRAQALKMLTLARGYAAFQENERGSIEVGKQTDFTVFDRDLMTVPDREILRARVPMTIIGREIAYSAPRGSR